MKGAHTSAYIGLLEYRNLFLFYRLSAIYNTFDAGRRFV
jgi:hypothetical protein